MDRVFINSLEVLSTIGVYEWEKTIKQKLVFDLVLAFDNRPAAATDDINLALDYAVLSQRVVEYAQNNVFELLETMAERVAALILDEFNVPGLQLTLSKPGAVVMAANVGVQITRGDFYGSSAQGNLG
ncbi:dihydroneopterin aldolase [Motilimonas cestriensis]|uniref:7,8-dihydroneopterin aldolase n=1 Tax=Motilimonas cestriensis TaxID=2742685 RepID=A0ABS8WEJ8_9GAMM|nr:dihydroneopterin aldolase [Motilimonas cestriensis]MCE2595984.1 dihydroneopterin aldolase [Motilimonas cestriensis]